MTQRVLILGARGLLGRALQRTAPPEVELHCPTREDLPLDDLEGLGRRLREEPVDRLFLLAAWTRVDDCEADPDRAFRINGILPGRIAAQAERRGLPLVFVSTDYVFDGAGSTPYREYDPIAPVNQYGRSKAYGEAAVREASRSARIVRTSGLYGDGGPDFVTSIRRALAAGGPLRVVADQITAPTWVDDLARALWVVGLGEEAGTFHLTAAGELSWCDFAREIALVSGDDPGRIAPITAAESGRAATRPAYSVLNGQRAREIFGLSMPDSRQALRAFLAGTGA